MSNVMIWGGTRGLGRELARLSVARGYHTTVTGRARPSDLEDGVRFVPANFSEAGDPSVAGGDAVGGGFYHSTLNADILFWVAGHWLRKPLHACTAEEQREMMNVHLAVPMLRLAYVFGVHAKAKFPRPLHLVTVSSSSAWKVRGDGQAAYGAVQAAKVQFARNVAAEYPSLIVRSTVVRPGGMRTGFFAGSDVDTAPFADPYEVARVIWEAVEGQRPSFVEMDVCQSDRGLRVDAFDGNGDLVVIRGADHEAVFGSPR